MQNGGSAERKSKWEHDLKLKTDLVKYVKERMQRIDILDFVQKNYPIHKCTGLKARAPDAKKKKPKGHFIILAWTGPILSMAMTN